MDKNVESVERRSTSANQEYKLRLNQLSEIIGRLEKVRRNIYLVNEPPEACGISGLKKTSPEISFLEILTDHTDYFSSLLNRLDKVARELEQF